MSEVLKTVSQTKKDTSLELSEFYSRIVKQYIEEAEETFAVISLPPDYQVVKKDFATIPLDAEKILRLLEFSGEKAILEENLYLLLNQLVCERHLLPNGSKLIPEVGLTNLGLIVGRTRHEDKLKGPVAFLIRLPAFQSTGISKENFQLV